MAIKANGTILATVVISCMTPALRIPVVLSQVKNHIKNKPDKTELTGL